MYPAAFDYERATSVQDAVGKLSANENAKLLAGGHSLIPLMKLRLADPQLLIDISRLGELDYVRDEGDHLAIGALTRHFEIERSELLRKEVPVLPLVAKTIGDPQVRHRGTIGGSVAHGDGASDLPAALLALEATMVAAGPSGTREIPAKEFFTGFLETALAHDEMLTEIRVPKGFDRASYIKFTRRAQDWAIVGVVGVRNSKTQLAYVNMGSTPLRAEAVEARLHDGATRDEAAAVAAEGLNPPSDIHASAEYRAHLASVLTSRVLAELGVQ
jgi:carbon-monoxide dehydrogenase medium subunit